MSDFTLQNEHPIPLRGVSGKGSQGSENISEGEAKRDASQSLSEIDDFLLQYPPAASTPLFCPPRPTVLLAMLVAIVMNVSYSLLDSFFPTYAGSKGAGETSIGAIYAAYPIAAFCSAPLASFLLQRMGAARLYAAGLLVESVATVGFGGVDFLTNTNQIVGVAIAVRIIQGAGWACSSAGCMTILMCDVPPAQLAVSLGAVEGAAGLGMLLGPGLGSVLFTYLGGFKTPFFAAGVLDFCFAIVVWTFSVRRSSPTSTAPASTLSPLNATKPRKPQRMLSVCDVLRSAPVVVAAVIMASAFSAMCYLEPTLGPFLHSNFGMPPTAIGLLFTLSTLLYALVSPAVGFLGSKFGYLPFMLLGSFISLLALLSLGPSPIPFLSFLPKTFPFQVAAILLVDVGSAMALVPATPYLTEWGRYVLREKLDALRNQRLRNQGQVSMKQLPSRDQQGVHESMEMDNNDEGDLVSDSEMDEQDQREHYETEISEILSVLCNASVSLGAIFGPIVGTGLVEYGGFRLGSTMFATCPLFAVLLVAVLWATRVIRSKPERDPTEPAGAHGASYAYGVSFPKTATFYHI